VWCVILCAMGWYVLIAILCGGMSAVLAMMKGRSPGMFFLWGVLFGPLGLAYAAFAAKGDELRRSSLSNHL
jgi:hypothetical protein